MVNQTEEIMLPPRQWKGLWFRLGVWMLRVLIGGVFVTSGFVKAVDPWGFMFKIEEYLAVWGMPQPRSVVLIAALVISGYEFVLGAMTVMGCYKRVAPWGLLLSMMVMLPLSLYLWIENPVSDCGCFGEFIILSNAATFWKNVALTAGLVVLIIYGPNVKEALFNPAIQWVVVVLAGMYILVIGLYGYNAQPMLDFRSYPVGTVVAGTDSGEEGDAGYVFIYEKNGERARFGIDNLPDSTWTFVDREEVSGDVDANDSPDNRLTVFTPEGEETNEEAFVSEGIEYILVIPEPVRADIAYSYTVNEIYERLKVLGIPMVAVLGGDSKAIAVWQDISMADYPCYGADETQLKEFARGAMSFVKIADGAVVSKTTVGSMNPEIVENPTDPRLFEQELEGHGEWWFRVINGVFGALILLIYAFQGIILTLRWRFLRRRRSRKS